MDFAFLPPEINSARMYSGPGSGSLLAAAGSWDSLSAELAATAQGYESVLAQLTGLEWRGAASEAMAATASGYMSWLQTAAAQTKQMAGQARAAATAYEHAHAMTVPPAAVTANRTRLGSLIATNIVGQNTAAIAATEAQYGEYWAQDSTAMSGYSASSASLTQLPTFTSPQPTTNESGVAAQTFSVNRANAAAVGSGSANALIQAPPQLAVSPTSSSFIPLDLDILDVIQGTGQTLNSTYYMEAFASGIIGAENNLGVLPKAAAAAAPAALAPALTAAPQLGAGAGLGNVTVSLARAGTIGPMSVPASWAAPVTSHVTAFEPLGMTTIPGTEEAMAASGYPGYPGMPGGAASRAAAAGAPPRYGVRLTVMGRPPAAG
ncbi:PPE family protein [Mycobacterium rhizamassiliense]|jgi:PPE-repeat protein|uniref:PPE family protein n=1 Tax=Mycobacterium rhizamassiliense TaxID=1841860 RepID=A0A2U3NLR6_9MYCO|nr:PPE family protein [Mycobacterium rhizamassiliense]SPM32375.1 PPE family protein [Mycobacterium rhizamassiliense]